MAVLFQSASYNYTLQPKNPAELLQGFLNIEDAEGVQNGKLTQANLASYGQKRFFAADPNSQVAGYLSQNYAQIAKLDGDASSISANDLVQIRQGMPTPPTTTTPPSTNPGQQPPIFTMLFQFMQQLMQMFSSMFRR